MDVVQTVHTNGHRKRQQAQHPKLTMTGMYNVLEKLRQIERANREGEAPAEPQSQPGSRYGSAGASPSRQLALTDKDKAIHEQGLVSVLKQFLRRVRIMFDLERGFPRPTLVRLPCDLNDLDAAVFEAYGWPVTLTDEETLLN